MMACNFKKKKTIQSFSNHAGFARIRPHLPMAGGPLKMSLPKKSPIFDFFGLLACHFSFEKRQRPKKNLSRFDNSVVKTYLATSFNSSFSWISGRPSYCDGASFVRTSPPVARNDFFLRRSFPVVDSRKKNDSQVGICFVYTHCLRKLYGNMAEWSKAPESGLWRSSGPKGRGFESLCCHFKM